MLNNTPKAPDKKDCNVEVKVLGQAQVTEEVSRFLAKGPKFSLAPRTVAHELLSLNRRVSGKASPENRERCLLDGVDALSRTASEKCPGGQNEFNTVVTFFKDRGLRLLQADKEGGLVVVPPGCYKEKTCAAVEKNFAVTSLKPGKVRSRAVTLCRNLDLEKIANAISKCKENTLSMFFTAKTHKVDVPFRCIVSERESRQRIISQFLLKHLNSLVVEDPFATKKSTDVIDFLQTCGTIGSVLSVDVKDLFLFYSPQRIIPSRSVLYREKRCGVISKCSGNVNRQLYNVVGIPPKCHSGRI